jgi:hypothetical protein
MMQFRAKVDAMLEERGMSLNELFLLAMYKTTVERKFSVEDQNYVLEFIEKRFQPQYKLYRFFKRLIQQ